MQIPKTYAQWVKALDMLKKGTDDAEVLEAMRGGTIEWQSGVAERFTKKLVASVNSRMNDAQDAFDKKMKRGGGEATVIDALLDLRKCYAFLAQVMDIPAIPEKDRHKYVELIREQADQVQKSLEDSARNDHTGKLLSIVRNHRINAF